MSKDIILTEADALADLNGTPRPDNQMVEMVALPVVDQPLPAHQERVIAERADLEVRIERLQAFIATETFEALDLAEMVRLDRQLNLQRQLSAVLAERIADF
jgi:hypothetical protein